jgi:hypothetical protein
MASPAHQTDHVGQNWLSGMEPQSRRVAVPQVALTVMLSVPKLTRATASRSRSSWGRKPAFWSRVAQRSGATVLPTAMPAAVNGDGPIGAFTRKAPRAIAGQTLRPNSKIPATAIPVGGQIGVTCPPTNATRRLRIAAT